MTRLARLIIRAAAWVAPAPLRARWREEWLAEVDAAPRSGITLARMAGAPWDALTSRWTARLGPDHRGGSWFGRRGEVKQAWRSLARTPWYAFAVAGVIALTMALTTTVFAIVDGVLFKPLPYRDVNRIFGVTTGYFKVPDSVGSSGVVSQFDVDAWRAALPPGALAAFISQGGSLTPGTDPRVPFARVDAAFFDVIGVKPLVGGFVAGDFLAAAAIQPAIITHGYWARRFGADPAVIGRTVLGEGGAGFRIAGILPADFVFPHYLPIDAITPLVRQDRPSRGSSLHVLVRLPEALSEEAASTRMLAATTELAATWPSPPLPPNAPERRRLMSGHFDLTRLTPIRAAITEVWSPTSWAVFWAAMALVALAAANVTGLALARLRDRWRELALRRSLGAGYADLARLLAIEHTLVIGAGTAVGIWAAHPALDAIVNLMSKNSQFLKTPAIDLRVFVFAGLTAAACIALITVVSARAASRSTVRQAIVEGGTTTRRMRGGTLIVGVQVALALVVAVGGALVSGSLLRVLKEDPGFDMDRAAILIVHPRVRPAPAEAEQLVDGLRQLPGIAHIGGVDQTVLDLSFGGNDFVRPTGVPLTTLVESMTMTADYLPAAGLATVAGRLPTQTEFESGAPVAVVSEMVAQQYWPGQSAVGQSLVNGVNGGRAFTVVGVVKEARYVTLEMEPQGTIYWPLAAKPTAFPYFTLVRFTRDGRASLSDVVTAITARCSVCSVTSSQMLTDALHATIKPRLFNAWLFSSFGVAALVIVGTGILGLVAMTTNRRTREIGIRMALGATGPKVVRQILREHVGAVAAGLLAGGVVAAWAVRLVSANLYKTPIYDGWAWVSAVGALIVVAALGAWMPSRRVSRLDPVQTLRVE